MRNIALIGMMGCGKSTVGQMLAQTLKRRLVDLDEEIVREAGCPISEVFARYGEAHFRDLEQIEAQRWGEKSHLVLAAGGGIVTRQASIDGLKINSVVVFLNRDPGTIYDRESMDGRPLAQDGRAAFLERFRQREPRYRGAADLIIDEFSTPEATVQAILTALEERGEL